MTKKVSFILPAEYVADAVSGVLVGEFNNWNPEEGIYLQRQEDGSMVAELTLSAGKTYEYRYLLSDGRWVNDNSNKKFSDVYGYAIENCIVDVPETIKTAKVAKPKTVKKEKAPIKIEANDLTKIEGINKKVEALLVKENIRNYKELAKATVKKLQLILDAAGTKFSLFNPNTWPKQAKMAATEKWEELAKWQDELKAGK